MLGLKSLFAKSPTDAELNRVKLASSREDLSVALEHYRPSFENIKVGINLLKRQNNRTSRTPEETTWTYHTLDMQGPLKMTAEAKNLLRRNITKDIEDKVKNCIACLSSGVYLKYQTPKNESGKLKTLTEPGQEIQIDFTGKLHNKNWTEKINYKVW